MMNINIKNGENLKLLGQYVRDVVLQLFAEAVADKNQKIELIRGNVLVIIQKAIWIKLYWTDLNISIFRIKTTNKSIFPV